MGVLISLLSTLFNAFLWFVIIAIIVSVLLCKWLYGLITQDNNSQSQTGSDDYDDGSRHCILGYSDDEQFCANCDLVEQCQGWSPRNKSEENGTKSDFFTFDHLLDSSGQYEEKNPYDHDSLNCDDCWCECHERDGYSWFDENGNDVDGDDSVW